MKDDTKDSIKENTEKNFTLTGVIPKSKYDTFNIIIF